MGRATPSILAALCAALLTSACAGSGDKYPSLAIRDAERVQSRFTPAPPSDRAPIRPVASASEIEALVDQAQASHAQFRSAQAQAKALVGDARGRGIDTNARQRALVALADLTALHGDTAVPMSDLDMLNAQAATSFAPTEAIEAARASILALLAEQEGTLNALWSELSR